MAKRKIKKPTRGKTGKVARNTRRESMMTGKQSRSPFFVGDVRPLI